MRYHIWTVGCQMNVADSERMAAALSALGATEASDPAQSDVIVLNTCSVRQAAENRAFGKLAALRNLKKERPDLIIALAGCMVGPDSHVELQRRLPFVDAFIRPADVDALCETVRALYPASSCSASAGQGRQGALDRHPKQSEGSPGRTGDASSSEDIRSAAVQHHRFAGEAGLTSSASAPVRWLPVIQGCNRACSYCIVPARRGCEQSRPLDEIVAEADQMVAAGAREVRLLGQIVDRYGWDFPEPLHLGDLFRRLSGIDQLSRIRFLTSHPRDLRECIIEAIAEVPKVCEDINIPLQAGDDAILQSMRRGYTTRFYRQLIGRLRHRIPGLALSTDVIVGYPGETAQQFQRTLDILQELQFDVVHVAMYSPRPGTLASKMTDNVPAEEKKDRLRRVEELQQSVAAAINSRLAGQTVEVLVEGQHKGQWEGRSRTNKPVFFSDHHEWVGKLANVRIERTSAWSLSGRLIVQ